MNTEVIARIVTKKGEIAAEVFRYETKSGFGYRYNGKWGAGCGGLKDIVNMIRVSMASRRGWVEVIPLPAI